AKSVGGRARLQRDRAAVPDEAGPRLHEPAAIGIADPRQMAVAAAVGNVARLRRAVDALALMGAAREQQDRQAGQAEQAHLNSLSGAERHGARGWRAKQGARRAGAAASGGGNVDRA